MRKRKTILTLVLSSCILISGCDTDFDTIYNCVAYGGCLTQNPEKKAEELINLIEQGDIASTINLFTATSVRHFTDHNISSTLAKKHNLMKQNGGIKYFFKERILTRKKFVELKYSIKYNNGDFESNYLDLYRKDGEWKANFSPSSFE